MGSLVGWTHTFSDEELEKIIDSHAIVGIDGKPLAAEAFRSMMGENLKFYGWMKTEEKKEEPLALKPQVVRGKEY